MSGEAFDPNQLYRGSPQMVLERTLIAEYLLSRGYLMTDLKELSAQAAERLLREACRFAALRLSEIEFRDPFQWMFRLPISLN